MESITTPFNLFFSLCLSLFVEDCLLFRHVLSRPLYTTVRLAIPERYRIKCLTICTS